MSILGEQASQSFTFTTLNEIEELIITKKKLRTNSKPLLVVGCGLTAIDVILLCQQYSIPVLHVFRRSIDDHELVLNQLPANTFPEYERIRELIRQSASTSSVRKFFSFIHIYLFIYLFSLVFHILILSMFFAE